ncbi:MAG: type II CRISPR RNA-guided endonuclease Cas9, partial [Planctomycetota bacterium]
EQGYAALSEKAMRALLPRLEQGERYATARQAVYGDRHAAGPGKALLPPALEVFPSLRNPVVLRSLTQLRKVVNALIRRYGTPERVHVELARDMKRSREQRTRIAASQRERRKRREEVAEKIRNELGFDRVRSADIEKVLLAEECRWHCPYTGRSISMKALLGKNPQFDIEHIVPFSRCLDNSFVNKTLCYHEENRNRKRNKTPYEAYGKDEQQWNEILQRVRSFAGDRRTVHEKLRRFQLKGKDLEKFVEDFQAHQLQDTRYASRLAADYLGVLFGGRVDEDRQLRVQVRTGQLTGHVRRALGLNRLLNDRNSNIKSRDDHRHHAIDALVIALADQAMVQRLARAAEAAPSERRSLFADLEEPWPDFGTEVAERVAAIVVSHAVRRKVSGPLHKETLYSRPIQRRLKGGKVEEVRRVRRELSTLKASEVERIADPVVRRRVKERLRELGGGDPARLFGDSKNLPWLEARDGRRIPIRKVRIDVGDKPVEIARHRRRRHVVPGNNHHMEVWEETRGGKTVWRWEVVTMLEAYRRVRAGEPVVRRDRGPGTRFLFSLGQGDCLRLTSPERGSELFVVKNISPRQIEIGFLFDARPATVIRRIRDRITISSTGRLQRCRAQKVQVAPNGDVVTAHD